MSAKPAKQPHPFRVGDDATMVGSTGAWPGTITAAGPMRVCFAWAEGSPRWFHRKADRWVGVKRDDLSLVPRRR